jgi:hypothetical protein
MRTLVCGIFLVASGCGLFGDSSSGSSESATLTSQNSSTETGTVVLTGLSSGTQITISTGGTTDTGAQSAVIRTGTCGSNGALFEELNNVTNDESVTTVSESISSLEGGKYYIDVHSSTDVTLVVACGAIP